MSSDDAGYVCVYCKEEIKRDAIRCKHCHSALAAEKPGHEGTCPYCKEQIQPEAVKCKHCKSNLASGCGTGCGCGDSGDGEITTMLRRLQLGTTPPTSGHDLSCTFAFLDCLDRPGSSYFDCAIRHALCRMHPPGPTHLPFIG